ncbi:MAG: N-acetylmuramoyl-L-alanine amidase [Acidobacteriota bacterium]
MELRSVRAWSGADATRIVVELSRETKWKYGRLSNPERLFVDFADTRPRLGPQRVHIVAVGDTLVERARVALKDSHTTRLVLDLKRDIEYELSHLTNPERLVIEIKAKGPGRAGPEVTRARPPRAQETVPQGAARAAPEAAAAAAARGEAGPGTPSEHKAAGAAKAREPVPARGEAAAPPAEAPARAPDASASASGKAASTAEGPKPLPETAAPQPARPGHDGTRSLTRALGLRIGRVVLDPGHGGHDQGTKGPTGLLEKDLVLDVALRLGAMIEERMGGEVVYTRRTDDFVPLEERTAIANEEKADLFLSIHANSSPIRRVSGAEVFYLNFTTSKEALDLAAKENAGHGKSIFELRELIQKIALKDKLEESREFAGFVQRELMREWKRLNSAARDRGVKKAPFVVLIGASMPSVLAEIGFLSNPRDEGLLKKPEYRERLAEALYRGVERYAQSLGQTQALRAATPAATAQSTR